MFYSVLCSPRPILMHRARAQRVLIHHFYFKFRLFITASLTFIFYRFLLGCIVLLNFIHREGKSEEKCL